MICFLYNHFLIIHYSGLTSTAKVLPEFFYCEEPPHSGH